MLVLEIKSTRWGGEGLKGKHMALEPDGHIHYVALGKAVTSPSSRFSSVGGGEHTMHGRK